MKTQSVRQGRKFTQVVKGAASVFLRDGFAGASVDDIAQAAQVSKATLYSYFPDKALMFQEAMRAEIARLEFRLDVDPGACPEAALPQISARMAEWLADPALVSLYRVHAAEATRFPALSTSFHDTLTGLLRDRIRPFLQRWESQGLLAIDNPDAAVDQLVGLAGAAWRDPVLLGRTQAPSGRTMRDAAADAGGLFLRAYAPQPQAVTLRTALPR